MKKHIGVMVMALTAISLCAQHPMAVQTVAVDKAQGAENVDKRRCIGSVVSPQRVALVDRVSEELLEVGFKEGDLVRKGQMLYRLNDEPYRAAVQAIEAKIKAVKARLDYAEKNYRRQETLLRRNVASQDEFDSAQTERDARKAELAELEAQLITAKKNLRDTVILSPIDGKIGFNNFTVGNYLTPASGTLATVLQINPIRVRFPLSNADYMNLFGSEAELKKEARVGLTLANGTQYPQEGRVVFVDNVASRSTDTVNIYAEFENADAVLIPGSTINVAVTKRTVLKCVSVISSAIVRDQQGAFVWVVNDQKVSKRRVKLGNAVKERQMILDGLEEGEVVVSLGTHKLIEGTSIKIAEAGK